MMASRQQKVAVDALLREWGNDSDLEDRFTPRSGERYGRMMESGETVMVTRDEFDALRDQGFIETLPGLDSLELGAHFEITAKGRDVLRDALEAKQADSRQSHFVTRSATQDAQQW